MDIHEVRQMLRYKTIYEIPLRVTYYARVSSDSDEQLNSLSNQVAYYEDLIRKNLPWTFIPGYIDEGLSGISTKKRENFNRMVDDAAEDSQYPQAMWSPTKAISCTPPGTFPPGTVSTTSEKPFSAIGTWQ